tara:strand:+ start:358 stop:591 length:234 start_codon:yes stop_codon:yes gene_type:complete
MYPQGSLINTNYNNLVIFEEDKNNPENEGFICFWKIKSYNNKKLIFKKRLSKLKAKRKWENLLKEGWKINRRNNIAA